MKKYRSLSRLDILPVSMMLPFVFYPEDYEQPVEQAWCQRDSGSKPTLKEGVRNMANICPMFLGLLILGKTAPPIIRPFFASNDFLNKNLTPFITHGGYRLSNSLSVIAAHASNTQLFNAVFSMLADQERQTLIKVTSWIGQIKNQRKEKYS